MNVVGDEWRIEEQSEPFTAKEKEYIEEEVNEVLGQDQLKKIRCYTSVLGVVCTVS